MEIIIAIVIALLIVRLFGAWMLRINEVIRQQKKTNQYLEEIYKQNKQTYLNREEKE